MDSLDFSTAAEPSPPPVLSEETAPLPVLPPKARRRFGAAEGALLLLCLFAFFWRLGSISLFDLDEALYVTCARQMVLTGDIVTPRLNSRPLNNPTATTVPFFEKPILVYWMPAASMRLFGLSEWAARLPAACAALLLTWVIVRLGVLWFGHRAGLLAGMIYATAPMTIADARQMTTDGLLVLWFTVALIAFWNSRRTQAIRWPLLFWTMCALAVLTKGAVGLLLPLLVIGLFLTLDQIALRVRRSGRGFLTVRFRLRLRRPAVWWPSVRALRPVLGLLLFVALATPWHYFVWRAGGIDANGHTFFREYVMEQHIGRFRGVDTVHNAPLITYIVYFLLGFFPWACFTPAAFRFQAGQGEPGETASEAVRFLRVWFWTIFLFFSLGAAKLPNYIVPAYPAAALLVGRWLDHVLSARARARDILSLRRGALAAVITSATLAIGTALAPRFIPPASPIAPAVLQFVRSLTLLLLMGSLLAWICFRRGTQPGLWRQGGVATFTVMMLAVIGYVSTAGYTLFERNILGPYQQIAADARADARAGIPVVYYHIIPRRPSMNYYARYSPLEHKETPLFPFLRSFLSPLHPEADVITARVTLDTELRAELAAHPDVSARVLAERGDNGGWVLLRLTQHAATASRSKNLKKTIPSRAPTLAGLYRHQSARRVSL